MTENLIVINVDFGETRVALIENGIIVELLLERREDRSIVGNIYRGRITRVLPGMQAAFVDIGMEKSAFLHVTDLTDQRSDDHNGSSKKSLIQDRIKEGKSLPVQVSKGPISTKGARVTAQISLPGRHLVYMPTSARGGVSRRIDDDRERARLAKVLKHISPTSGALIVRTVAQGISADALAADADYLTETWDDVYSRFTHKRKPGLLYEELDLPLRVARDRLNDSVSEIVVDDKRAYDKLRRFIDRLMPSRLDSLKLYQDDEPIFDAFGIESEIRRALERRVALPSGGSLIIDQAEALTAIDVNTGKFVGRGAKDLEETILTTNLEAIEEIAYQLRFRNIGGLIVLDLIDMDRPQSRQQVLSKLKDLLQDDRAKASVKRISEFGLVEMTRQRTTDSLGRMLHEACYYCDGTGQILSRATVANEALREVRRRCDDIKGDIELTMHPHVVEVLKGRGAEPLKALQKRISKKIKLVGNKEYHHEEFYVRPQLRSSLPRKKKDR
jgi:ribonuclease G